MKFAMMRYSLICLLILGFHESKAQSDYMIQYTASIMSASINDRITQEVKDVNLRKAYTDLMSQYKVVYNFYIKSSSNESLLVETKEYPLDGPPPFKIKTSYANKEKYYSEVFFRGKTFKIADQNKSLKWNITNEKQKIGAFACQKAILENDPFHTIVWFSQDIPLPYGPLFSNGLPGAVILYEQDYFTLKMDQMNKKQIPATILEQMKNLAKNQGISLTEFFSKTTPLLKKMKTEKIIDD